MHNMLCLTEVNTFSLRDSPILVHSPDLLSTSENLHNKEGLKCLVFFIVIETYRLVSFIVNKHL